MSDSIRDKIKNASPEERLILEKILGPEILEAVGFNESVPTVSPESAPKSQAYVFHGNEVVTPADELPDGDPSRPEETFTPEPIGDIWFTTALNLPSWLTDSSDKDHYRLAIRRRNGYEEIVTPDRQQVVLVTESGSHIQPLLYQDVLAFRSWKQRGGPKWKKGLGVNLHTGERMWICPYEAAGTPEAFTYEQPWKAVVPKQTEPTNVDYEERTGGTYRTPPKVTP